MPTKDELRQLAEVYDRCMSAIDEIDNQLLNETTLDDLRLVLKRVASNYDLITSEHITEIARNRRVIFFNFGGERRDSEGNVMFALLIHAFGEFAYVDRGSLAHAAENLQRERKAAWALHENYEHYERMNVVVANLTSALRDALEASKAIGITSDSEVATQAFPALFGPK